MKPVLLLLALAGLIVAWVVCFGFGGEPRVAPSVTTASADHVPASHAESAKLDGSDADRERRSTAASAAPPSSSGESPDGASATAVVQPEPLGEVAYSEPTELVHFALQNTEADFEGKYREQGKAEFTANLQALETVLEMHRANALDEKSRLDPKEIEILESRVKWMQAFAQKFR
jgi:hypothetical protein